MSKLFQKIGSMHPTNQMARIFSLVKMNCLQVPGGMVINGGCLAFPQQIILAAGIYNQYIYIDPITNVVIAKTSSNYKFNQEREHSKDAHVAMFRAIAKSAAESFKS